MKTSHAAAVVFASISGSAAGEIVQMRFLGTDEGRNVRISHGPSGHTQNVFAGGLRHEVVQAEGLGFLEGVRVTYCVEIFEHVDADLREYDTRASSLGRAQTDMIASVIGASTLLEGVAERDRQAATQLLVWEAVYDYDEQQGDSSLDVTGGAFTVTKMNSDALWGSVFAAMDLIVERLGDGAQLGVTIASRDGAQDQAMVPAPGALAALGGGLVATRRRRAA